MPKALYSTLSSLPVPQTLGILRFTLGLSAPFLIPIVSANFFFCCDGFEQSLIVLVDLLQDFGGIAEDISF